MTIQEIKNRTRETSPYFFSEKTMRFFGQTLNSFKVEKQGIKYLISAPMHDGQRIVGTTKRLFNPETNELEYIG
jgi:hypothetical protein